jgi:hypothetical protein
MQNTQSWSPAGATDCLRMVLRDVQFFFVWNCLITFYKASPTHATETLVSSTFTAAFEGGRTCRFLRLQLRSHIAIVRLTCNDMFLCYVFVVNYLVGRFCVRVSSAIRFRQIAACDRPHAVGWTVGTLALKFIIPPWQYMNEQQPSKKLMGDALHMKFWPHAYFHSMHSTEIY